MMLSAPSINMGSLDGPNSNTSDLIIGERFVGETSGAVAVYIWLEIVILE